MEYARYLDLVERFFQRAGTVLKKRGKDYPETKNTPEFVLIDENRKTYYLTVIANPPEKPEADKETRKQALLYAEENRLNPDAFLAVLSLAKDLHNSRGASLEFKIGEGFQKKLSLVVPDDLTKSTEEILKSYKAEFQTVPLKGVFTIYFFSTDVYSKLEDAYKVLVADSLEEKSAVLNRAAEEDSLEKLKAAALEEEASLPDIDAPEEKDEITEDDEDDEDDDDLDLDISDFASVKEADEEETTAEKEESEAEDLPDEEFEEPAIKEVAIAEETPKAKSQLKNTTAEEMEEILRAGIAGAASAKAAEEAPAKEAPKPRVEEILKPAVKGEIITAAQAAEVKRPVAAVATEIARETVRETVRETRLVRGVEQESKPDKEFSAPYDRRPEAKEAMAVKAKEEEPPEDYSVQRASLVFRHIWSFLAYCPAYLLSSLVRGRLPDFVIYWMGGIASLLGVYFYPFYYGLKTFTTFAVNELYGASAALTEMMTLANTVSISPQMNNWVEFLFGAAFIFCALNVSFLQFLNSVFFLHLFLAAGYFVAMVPAWREFGKRMIAFFVTAYLLYTPLAILAAFGGTRTALYSMSRRDMAESGFALMGNLAGIVLIFALVPALTGLIALKACRSKRDVL